MLDYAVRITNDPANCSEEDIDELRAVGYSDEEIWQRIELKKTPNDEGFTGPSRLKVPEWEVLTNPPPSAGGTLLAYALALLDL